MLKVFLVTCFVISVVVVIMPLIAESQFNMGRFEEAIKTDPFNAKYAALYGKYLFGKSFEIKERNDLLEKAQRLLVRAIRLNPVNAEYYMMMGQIETGLYLRDKKDAEWASKAISSFQKAAKFDPNGFYISYSIGYAGLSLWKNLNEDEKSFILNKLKYCLRIRPNLKRHIYSKLWQETADPALLEKLMTEEEKNNKARRLDEIKNDAFKYSNAWSGITADGTNKYRNGAMYWAGTMDTVILVPPGKSMIKIQAKGSPAGDIFPYMIVELDGKMIGEAYIRNTDWINYKFTVNTNGGVKVLSVTFVNDGANPAKGEDRNLFIGSAEAI